MLRMKQEPVPPSGPMKNELPRAVKIEQAPNVSHEFGGHHLK